jgi:hypothetical protein
LSLGALMVDWPTTFWTSYPPNLIVRQITIWWPKVLTLGERTSAFSKGPITQLTRLWFLCRTIELGRKKVWVGSGYIRLVSLVLKSLLGRGPPQCNANIVLSPFDLFFIQYLEWKESKFQNGCDWKIYWISHLK